MNSFAAPGKTGLVVRYNDRIAILGYYVLALSVFSLAIAFVYADPWTIAQFEKLSSMRDERRIMLNGLSAFWIAIFIDFVLQARAFLKARPALVVDREGVHGLHGGLWRSISWADIHEIEITTDSIRFVRRPRNPLSELIFRLYANSRRAKLGEYAIHVLARRTDIGLADIVHIVGRYRPDLV
ncbi:MAG: hypothetical protein KDJ74_11225 [Notoacmeibacter sp.]|nr:hypothetical protein [Notoacmeibacter sp.]